MPTPLEEPFEIVDIPNLPTIHRSKWVKILNEIPEGKAIMYKFNTRQRAFQVASSIRSITRYVKIDIATKTYHGIPEIHGTDKWLLYVWRKEK